MSFVQPVPDVISRESLIAALRQELAGRTDDRSMCSLAAEKGIFCGGFKRFSDRELKQRMPWLARKNPFGTRAEIERLADAWQLGRQEAGAVATACDVQQKEHDLCNGWDDFSDDDLTTFYREFTGTKVRVSGASGE